MVCLKSAVILSAESPWAHKDGDGPKGICYCEATSPLLLGRQPRSHCAFVSLGTRATGAAWVTNMAFSILRRPMGDMRLVVHRCVLPGDIRVVLELPPIPGCVGKGGGRGREQKVARSPETPSLGTWPSRTPASSAGNKGRRAEKITLHQVRWSVPKP